MVADGVENSLRAASGHRCYALPARSHYIKPDWCSSAAYQDGSESGDSVNLVAMENRVMAGLEQQCAGGNDNIISQRWSNANIVRQMLCATLAQSCVIPPNVRYVAPEMASRCLMRQNSPAGKHSGIYNSAVPAAGTGKTMKLEYAAGKEQPVCAPAWRKCPTAADGAQR